MASEPAPDRPEADALVDVRDVTKRYPLFARRRDRGLAFLGRTGGIPTKTAVDRVSLTVGRGEAVGIIGENGSGKSTLLRIVAGISAVDAGTVWVREPVAAILELGLGFHPEFTGRENALLYGSLVGISDAEMRARLDEILAFAQLGEFVDQPLRTYSSGMSARLAFSVATHVNPEVLVVDEALAVGDGAFQKKCVDRMTRFKDEGRGVLFCSHAMYLVTSFCQRAVWLRDGRVEAEGPADRVVEAYEEFLQRKEISTVTPDAPGDVASVVVSQPARIRSLGLRTATGEPASAIAPGSALFVDVDIAAVDPARKLHVAVSLDAADGRCVFAAATHRDGVAPLSGKTAYRLTVAIPSLPLARGSYTLLGFVLDDAGLALYDQAAVPAALSIVAERWTSALLDVPHRWEIDP